MIVYSIIMFACAAALLVVGILVYRGKTQLIHAYHQTNVKDKKGYGRAMGKALAFLSVPPIAAGTAGFFTTSAVPTVILIAGMTLSFIPLLAVQKKYNGGLF